MSAIDDAVKANESYARNFNGAGLAKQPARKLAVVACMDARLMPSEVLGLGPGDAHIIRNAGGVVTEDVLRSLLVSHHLLGTQEVIIINHTDCGMMGFEDKDLVDRLEKETGVAAVAPSHFYTFDDLEENVRQQVNRVKSHAWLQGKVTVRGFVYDVETGKLNEVKD